MAQFLSNLSKTAKTVPQNFVFPSSLTPKMAAPIWKEITVIDLSLAMSSDVHDRAQVAEKLLKAFEDGWGFQVINHGVSKKLMDDAMEVYKELFNLPVEEKEKLATGSTNPLRSGLYSGNDNHGESIHFWRDTLVHKCYPPENYVDSWPQKPSLYRKVIAEYSIETRKLTQKIFDLVAEGLGIEKQCFEGKFSEIQNMMANYYPKCPNPGVTVGICAHHDHPCTVTLVQQNVSGLQIISNGRFKATLDQVATNADVDRVSIGVLMIASSGKTCIEPAKEFITDENPLKHKAYSFEKFVKFTEMKRAEGGLDIVGVAKSALDCFLI